MQIPVYYISFGDLNTISLVSKPAIETDFQLFGQLTPLQFSLNEEKRIAFGPAIVADKPIYREKADGTPYYVVFTKEVIEQMVTDAFKSESTKSISAPADYKSERFPSCPIWPLSYNLEHSGTPVDGIYLIESFITRPGLSPIGFEEVAEGSWFVSLKIDNDEVWQQLKEGKFRGFSIEALVDIEEQLTEDPEDPLPDPLDEAINSVLD